MPAAKMKRVLIVEDDEAIRDNITEVLVDEGYSVVEARNGLEALRVALERRPDVILLDLMMPVMNGWEFLAEQRREPALAKVPVVILSAVDPDRLRAVEDVAELIPKPFDLDKLLEAVQRHAVAA